MRKVRQIFANAIVLLLILGMFDGCATAPKVTPTLEPPAAPTEVQPPAPIRVGILFFNDIHGHLEPFTVKEGDATIEVGGLARLAALIKRFEEENRQRGFETYVVIAGDILQGTPLSTVFQGKPDIECFNAIGIDAMTVGNHEFDFGLENFLALKKAAQFPILSSNIVYKADGKLLCQPWTSIEVAPGINLSIIGVTTEQLLTSTKASNVAALDVTDAIKAVSECYEQVSTEGPVLLLSHCPAATDELIAQANPGLAALIGGHDQILLNPRKLVGAVPVYQAFEKGRYLGRLELSIDPVTKKTTEELWNYLPVSAQIPADPTVAAIVAEYSSQLDARFKEVIGNAEVFFDGERERIRYQETNLGNLVTDIMRDTTGVMIAVLNGGALRSSIDEGPITVEEVFKAMPYSNEIVVTELTGEEIMQVLNRSVRGGKQDEDGGFLHVSGMRCKIIDRKPAEVIIGDAPLKPDAVYSVAITDFMATGGDGYDLFINKKTYKTGSPLRELIVDFIRSKGSVTAKIEGRIVRVE